MAIITRQAIPSFGEKAEKKGTPCTLGGTVDWYSHYGEPCGDTKKLKIELPYDPPIPLLSIYPKKMQTPIWKDVCTLCTLQHIFNSQDLDASWWWMDKKRWYMNRRNTIKQEKQN